MPNPTYIILYVGNAARSAAFYADLLGLQPAHASPTFALFALDSGTRLGLWSKHAVEPAATEVGGGSEITFPVADAAAVAAKHADWSRRGLPILQAPVRMDFGETFVAQDPDGHRLRVCALNAA